ncbi:sugar ABC transporter substrate-binding protein [Listeria monocytogenes]|uniref:extracellular solute-binding protein n=1 Tax=Listeria monocytogenes TaxID=1639 RepID=UPI00083D9FAA|nr:sugar ABC transporter substrate-binding protein [Listeria monocytogenes]
MKIRKIAIAALSVVVAGSLLTACGGGNSKSDDNGKTKVTFWAAPNPTQVKYWDEMAKAYEKENPDVTIEVSQMKESPSSEATIQSAIASKTAPTMSENINRSFAAQLADSKAIVPLNDVKGLDDVVKERNMSETMDSWKFSDGNQYVLPVYSNPILFAWRLDTLKELGYDAPPKTYSEALEVGKKLKAKYPDKVLWAKGDLSDPTAWMRWFDFFPLYDAASKGNAFVEDGKLVADDKAGTELLTFMSELQKNKLLLASKATDPFETGTSIMADNGPWTFPNWDEKFPELKYNENYAITAPLVPDNMANEENVATYADSKGVVMYAQATDKEKEAAMDGSGRFRTFWKVTVPMLYPALFTVIVLAVGVSFGIFTEVYQLTGGGPNFATNTWQMEIFNQAFVNLNSGYASAISLMAATVTFASIGVIKKMLEKWGQRNGWT